MGLESVYITLRFLHFQNSNSRSKLFNIQSIKNFLETKFYIFFEFFIIKISDFKTDLINSKQISKNIKFGVQTNFNIDIIYNSLDRPFEL